MLRERDEALLARARVDLDTQSATSFDIFYAILPATATSALLAKR